MAENTEFLEFPTGININIDIGNNIDIEQEEEMIHPPDLEHSLFTELFVKYLEDDVENLIHVSDTNKDTKLISQRSTHSTCRYSRIF